MSNLRKHQGSCHCGHLRFEVVVDATTGIRCNCTFCTKLAYLGTSVKPEAFTALTDESTLGCYEFGGKVAKKYFCPRCGVHAYSRGHLAELGGDFVSINFNCLDDIEPAEVQVLYWDGRHDNWEAGPRPTPWPIQAR